MPLKCLIVDDEELALDVLEQYISSIPSLSLAGRCDNAIEAISFLHSNAVDLMFLDLNMPELSGLEMLKTLENPPKIILTTAYAEYALESYEYGVVDYLLKPIKLERFIKAVNRAASLFSNTDKAQEEPVRQKPESVLFIKTDEGSKAINYSEIICIEAYGNYCKVHRAGDYSLTRETMQHFMEKLPEKQFLRAHKSFIINKNHIKRISGNMLFTDKTEIPLGSTYKNELMKALER